jgi:integrase
MPPERTSSKTPASTPTSSSEAGKPAESRRASGTGTIEQRQNPDGTVSYRARVPTKGGTKLSGPWVEDDKDAERWRLKLLRDAVNGKVRSSAEPTLAEYWAAWIAELERLRKPRALHYDRAWRQHVRHYPIGRMHLSRVDRAAARTFVTSLLGARVADGSRDIAPNTARAVVTAVSACLSHALKHDKVRANPFAELEIEWPEETDEADLEYLELAHIEQLASSDAVDDADRLIVLFYIFTGLRAGEGVYMPLADLERAVQTGELFVRYGSKGRKPKGGKTRTVPLLPAARDIAEEWLARLPAYCPDNHLRLAFPMPSGCERKTNAVLGLTTLPDGGKRSRWHDVQEAAGVRPGVVWHGLRHTCGAALASGWWGRVWSLHEIRDLLGHASVVTTEKYYGHLAPSALRSAANDTDGGPAGPHPPKNGGTSWRKITSSRCGEKPVVPGGCEPIPATGTAAGLRDEIDARLERREYPTPDECAELATALLRRDPFGAAALAVVDAAPEYRLARLLDLLRLVPEAAPAKVRAR